MRSAVHKGPNSLNIHPEGGGGDIGGEAGGGEGGGGGFSKALQALVLISRALTLPMLGRGGSGVVVVVQ